MSQDSNWIEVCATDEIDEDDAVTVERGGRDIAVYRTATGFYATDGICSHAHAVLSDGLIMDDVVECPLHQGRFHIPTGKALSAPACDDLRTYPVSERDGRLYIRIGG